MTRRGPLGGLSTVGAALAAVIAGLLAVPSARALEVGECAAGQRRSGAYGDPACTTPGVGRFTWVSLAGVVNGHYTDGSPWVLRDEAQEVKGAGIDIKCVGEITVGEVTGPATTVQWMENHFCEERKPTRAACGNVEAERIDSEPEEGVFVEREGHIFDELVTAWRFTCGSTPTTLEGPYEGTVERGSDTTKRNRPLLLDECFPEAYVVYGEGRGAQELTLTYGLVSEPVELEGEQEDKFGPADTKTTHQPGERIVFREGDGPSSARAG